MGVSYDGLDSPLVKESEIGIWKAGKRCPDVEVSVDGKQTRLYNIVSYGNFMLLEIGTTKPSAIQMAISLDGVLSRYRITTGGETSAPEANFTSLVGEWATEDEPLYVVVRPDMYIGYTTRDVNEVKQYLEDVFDV